MFKLTVVTLLITFTYANPVERELSSVAIKSCCVDHRNKPKQPSTIANYNCQQLSNFGKDRCEGVYGGGVCNWLENKYCNPAQVKCQKVPFYQNHYGKTIDVGRCIGSCPENKCIPDVYKDLEFHATEGQKLPYTVRVIETCKCDTCSVEKYTKTLELDLGKCEGECDTVQGHRVCNAGVSDQFSQANGNEPSYPSPLLLSNYLSMCSAGVQTGFDIFTDNKCFGHTFTDCFKKGPCDLKKAVLHMCLKAANVPLTYTDSMMLGVNGSPLWSISLPTLNGGTWNQGETMCKSFDLAFLPGGGNILGAVEGVGHLDVAVQDDTAVDYLQLNLYYDECQKCLPTKMSISSLVHNYQVQDFKNIENCDCINMEECHLEDLYVTVSPGTLFEKTVNVGQCVGRCPKLKRCVANEVEMVQSVNLLGRKELQKIVSCKCDKFTWNSVAEIRE